MRYMRRQRHVFLAPRHHNFRIAQLHMHGPQRHRPQTRSAHLIKRPGRCLFRQTRFDMRLTRRVLALPCCQNLPQNGFRNLGLINACAGNNRLNHCGTQIVGGRCSKHAVKAANSRACRRYDYNIGHQICPFCRKFAGQPCARRRSLSPRPSPRQKQDFRPKPAKIMRRIPDQADLHIDCCSNFGFIVGAPNRYPCRQSTPKWRNSSASCTDSTATATVNISNVLPIVKSAVATA